MPADGSLIACVTNSKCKSLRQRHLIVQLCMGLDEETLVTGGYDQAVRVWDMRSRSYDAIQTIKLFADSVTAVAVSARCPELPYRYAQSSTLLSTGTVGRGHVASKQCRARAQC